MAELPKEEESTKPKEVNLADAAINRSSSILTGVVLPIILLIVALIVLMSSDASRLLAPCDHYLSIKLIYPLIFGGLGAIVGGNIRLDGPIVLFGNKWDAHVAGGIAAALLGLGIAIWVEPKSCTPRQELTLQNFITKKEFEVTVGGKKVVRSYIARFDSSDRDVQIIVDKSRDNSRDLKFLFTGQDKFLISLDFFRRADPSSQYDPIVRCLIDVRVGSPPQKKDDRQFQLVATNTRFELEFNPLSFEQFEEALKKGPVPSSTNCLIGQSQLNGKEAADRETVSGALYAKAPSGWPMKLFKPSELWFTSAQTSEETTASARGPEATEGEATRPSVTATASAPVPPIDPPVSKPRVVTGCNPDTSTQAEIDKYLAGDDLDRNRRNALYSNWKDIHCYAWSLVRTNDAQTGSTERSRAIKLTVNAIINESQIAGQSAYWQSSGANRRDFARDLPYLAQSDYRLIFDSTQVDDVLVRGEALRMVRALPVDKFEILFRNAGDGLGSMTPVQRERLAIAAAFMYYNRIVEWLDVDPTPVAKIISSIEADFKASRKWITDSALGKSTKSYDAMLMYARGIVERERELTADKGQSSFTQMAALVRQMEDSYPSNFRHIGQSLAISQGAASALDILRQITQVDTYPPGTPFFTDPTLTDATLLYAGPGDQFPKLAKTTTGRPAARLLLRKDDWYLANGPGWVGWFRKPAKV